MKTITARRLEHSWSKAELGRQARIHPARVGQVENGRVIPYDVELRRLADALRFKGDPVDLLADVDPGENDAA